MSLPVTASFAEFATLARRKRSYITQLKDAGRLVLTEDGKRVRVAESLALIEQTRDPSRAGVAARHAANREAGGAVTAPGASAAPCASQAVEGGEPDPDAAPPDSHAARRSKALADKEEALARKALRDEALELGQLMLADQVLSTVSAGVTALRVRLETLAFDLAPQLAALHDEARVRALLSDEFENALRELTGQFQAMAKGAG